MLTPDHGQMEEYIKLMWDCRNTCQETFFNYCLQQGGHHVEPMHAAIMIDCIQICQVAADFMTRYSTQHQSVCNTCADVCTACADSCEQMNDERMKQCAEICRRCADACRKMATPVGEAAG